MERVPRAHPRPDPELPEVRAAWFPYTMPWNLTGHPAMAVKCGIVNNAPQMLMLTGRLYDEGTMARVALAFEQATEWKDRHPKLNA